MAERRYVETNAWNRPRPVFIQPILEKFGLERVKCFDCPKHLRYEEFYFVRTYKPDSMPPLPNLLPEQEEIHYPNLFVLCRECSSKDPIPSIDMDPFQAVKHWISTSKEIQIAKWEQDATINEKIRLGKLTEQIKTQNNALEKEIAELSATKWDLMDMSSVLKIDIKRLEESEALMAEQIDKQRELLIKIDTAERKTREMWEKLGKTPTFYQQLSEFSKALSEEAAKIGDGHVCAVCAQTTNDLCAITPCFHIYCKECAEKCHTEFTKCYSCQTHTTGTQKVYLV